MWIKVIAKKDITLTAYTPRMITTKVLLKGSKWKAIYEPEEDRIRPWRIKLGKSNLQVSEERFPEMFEECGA